MTAAAKHCRGCDQTKPVAAFRTTVKASGRRYPRTICSACENAERIEQRRRRTASTRDPQADLRSIFHVEREAWMDQAACRGVDTRRFFPGQGEPVADIVRETCDRCPVRNDCFDYAIRTNTRWGIWGGVGEATRKAWRRKAAAS